MHYYALSQPAPRQHQEEPPIKFLFKDPTFSFETLRCAGFSTYGGADLGEVISTAQSIRNGNEQDWLRAWHATAERVHRVGEDALSAGHRVSAREALLRASNYYRTAEFFQRRRPATDPMVALLSDRSRETFSAAVGLLEHPSEEIRIPYKDTTLPGYLFLVDDSGAARATVIYNSGYDSTAEESYFAVAAAALRRGYNVLAFDGPGQGAALREQRLVFRPDWEAVISPVIDFACARPEIDSGRISLFGYSLGALLIARAAAFESRVAALILDDGLFDFHAPFAAAIPGFVNRWIAEGRDARAGALMSIVARFDVGARWGLRNGVWAMGAGSFPDLIRKTQRYSLEALGDRITAPTLILDADEDHFLKGQPQQVKAVLTNARADLVTLTAAEGAGEHCHMGALSRAHQVMFDWLDATLTASLDTTRSELSGSRR
jgi:pimeloyl-ACP methyl ester carboxylesterase